MSAPIRIAVAKPMIAATAVLLTACTGGASAPEGGSAANAFDAISESETLKFTGTEPFWGGEVEGTSLTYTTPDNIDGTTITVKRFEGLNGLGLSGELDGERFDLAVSEAQCSDGMSDRTYPFTVTLSIGEETRSGCGWTDARLFTGPENP